VSRAPQLRDNPALLAGLQQSHYALTVTTRCQQHCQWCFEGDHGQHEDTPVAQARAQLIEAKALVPVVTFMGAETTLHPDFIELLELARSIGLQTATSTNLLRFADERFLSRCLEAGLSLIEFSFHYPHADAFAALTRTPRRNFARLLLAMDHVAAACRRINEQRPQGPHRAASANVIVSLLNVDAMPAVLQHLTTHLGPTLELIAFKRLMQRQLNGTDIDDGLAAPGNAIRRALTEVLDAWPAPATTAILRDFPLCIAPGYEHLHADLLYVCRKNGVVMENFGRLPTFRNMYDREQYPALPWAPPCRACSVASLCQIASRGLMHTACGGLDPIPSRIDPVQLLVAVGLDREEAETFCATLAAPPATALTVQPARRGEDVAAGPQETLDRVRFLAEAVLARAQVDGVPRTVQRVRWMAMNQERRAVEIDLAINSQPLSVWLMELYPGLDCLVRGQRWGLGYRAGTAPVPRSTSRILRAMLLACDLHL